MCLIPKILKRRKPRLKSLDRLRRLLKNLLLMQRRMNLFQLIESQLLPQHHWQQHRSLRLRYLSRSQPWQRPQIRKSHFLEPSQDSKLLPPINLQKLQQLLLRQNLQLSRIRRVLRRSQALPLSLPRALKPSQNQDRIRQLRHLLSQNLLLLPSRWQQQAQRLVRTRSH